MAKKKRRRVKAKQHIISPVVTGALLVSFLSVGTIFGTQLFMDNRKEDVSLKVYASGIVQKEKFSKDLVDEAIFFDKKYTTDSSDLVYGEYTDGVHLKEQLIANGVRCCCIGGKYYSLTGETVMVYSKYINEDVTREGVIYPDEMKRFIIPNGISLDDCEMYNTIPYEEMCNDLVISEKKLDLHKALVLS